MQEPGPASANETGPIPAVGIPEKYKQECSWGDCPIYSCDHCRRNGTFQPERFNYLSAADLEQKAHSGKTEHTAEHHNRCEPRELRPAATSANTNYPRVRDRISGPFLNDRQIRAILEGWGIKQDGVGRDPVNESLSRGHFGKGRPGMENRGR